MKHRNSPYYSPALAQIAEEAAKSISVTLRSGVYCAVKGPSYETPAEVEMLFRLGADAVGMSTVPEVTLAHRIGIEVLGLSLISNMATGITRTKQLHDDVTRTARVGARNLTALLQQIISRLHN